MAVVCVCDFFAAGPRNSLRERRKGRGGQQHLGERNLKESWVSLSISRCCLTVTYFWLVAGNHHHPGGSLLQQFVCLLCVESITLRNVRFDLLHCVLSSPLFGVVLLLCFVPPVCAFRPVLRSLRKGPLPSNKNVLLWDTFLQ